MDQNKPNIIFIISDQLRHDMLGCYGHPSVITPNLDALAKESALFKNCYATNPFCLPSRASMITGKYCHEHHCHTNNHVMSREHICAPALLRDEGYFTAIVGKLHLWEAWKSPSLVDTGFDYWDALEGKISLSSRVEYSRHYFDYLKDKGLDLPYPYAKKPEVFRNLWARISEYQDEDYIDTYLTTRAIRIIEENEGHPFFMQLGICSPHEFYDPPQEYYDMYEGIDIPDPVFSPEANAKKSHYLQKSFAQSCKEHELPTEEWDEETLARIREMRRHYLATVTLMDRQVGRVIQALKDKGIYENTAIVFLADHGEFQGDHGCIKKFYTLYDCNVHIPLMVHAPFLKDINGEVDGYVQNHDVFSTFLDLAGIEDPGGHSARSLLPIARGEEETRATAFAEVEDRKMIVKGGRKLVIDKRDVELYDLAADPLEQYNLAHEAGSEINEEILDLQRELIMWMHSTERPLVVKRKR